MFQFHMKERSDQAGTPGPRGSAPYVVVRAAAPAPCGFIFFDGSETVVVEAGQRLILPGGAFFPAEAHLFQKEEAAGAEARRLNGATPCAEPPWYVLPLAEATRGAHGAEAEEASARRRRTSGLRWRR